ncbi:MAG: hypothetical protein P4L79_15595 [Legionella sp.]|uniref:RCC1 domain-containing protein n=1 Tax=Legionella sp. TaxID=459 RepID=UPI00283CD5D7|nr:hypothetical protein [Legionella sp.]
MVSSIKNKQAEQSVQLNGHEVPADALHHMTTFMDGNSLRNFVRAGRAFFNVVQQRSDLSEPSLCTQLPNISVDNYSITFCDDEHNACSIYPYGYNEFRCISEHKITSLSGSKTHQVWLTDAGSVYVKKDTGEFLITGFSLDKDERINRVYAGNSVSFALSTKNKLYGWGANTSGELAQGNTIDSAFPLEIVIPNKEIREIAVGSSFVLALTTDNQIYAWGANRDGQLGLESKQESYTTPQEIIFFKDMNIRAIYAQGNHAFVIANNQVFAFGGSRNHQLGLLLADANEMKMDPEIRESYYCVYRRPMSVSFPDADFIVMLAAGHSFTLALTLNGELYGWGKNILGRSISSVTPVILDFFNNKKVISAFANGDSYLTLTSEEELNQFNKSVLNRKSVYRIYFNQQEVVNEQLQKTLLKSSRVIREYALHKAYDALNLDDEKQSSYCTIL